MSINVNNNNVSKPLVDNQKLQQQQGQSTNQAQAQQASVAQTAARSDSVSLTQSAQQLSQLHKKGSEASTVNQEKVDRLKKAIQAGDYKVNPEKLAQNIAKFESELFGIK
ncbi:flagellar biosynthesis anti-sigma factor FlgM [Neptunicella marina]|uniref:Negative regulator of flagellin synthesis n=1 Tax=Neptunicella marina TaxID=2125989 RepID=A0A8J6IW47_9ALTE|nr:flagellar biosynthesis anti-sigma factor FlgM [Neptunicella marina]MBC3766797.1 flagellar biosynthesis anti-sigma factor FlgM [Neptunicella marina]